MCSNVLFRSASGLGLHESNDNKVVYYMLFIFFKDILCYSYQLVIKIHDGRVYGQVGLWMLKLIKKKIGNHMLEGNVISLVGKKLWGYL